MSEYKGKIHETAVKFPDTDIWMDNCGLEELEYGVDLGNVGATSNPIIVGTVVKKEISIWESRIRELAAEMPLASEDDIVWALIDEIGAERSKLLLPAFEKHAGKKGRLSIQTNAKYFRDPAKMVEHALHLNSLAANMQIKMPISKAGIKAFEEVTYRGASINATVSFTLDQALAVAEAVERGLERRVREGLPIDKMSPVCTIMIGRIDDWIKESTARDDIIVNPEALEWAGVAVCKKAYEIFKERGYRTRILLAAMRNHYHWSQFIGGDICITIPYNWQRRFNESDVEVVSRIGDPVNPAYIEELLAKSADFRMAYNEGSLSQDEFTGYGAFVRTIDSFLSGYDDLCRVIRKIVVGEPIKR